MILGFIDSRINFPVFLIGLIIKHSRKFEKSCVKKEASAAPCAPNTGINKMFPTTFNNAPDKLIIGK